MKSVLIVEDDPFIAVDLQDAFEDAGYDVNGPHATVKSALKSIELSKPDAAILDYNLGSETSKAVAAKLAEHTVPYVYASGQMNRLINEGDENAAGIIGKPFLISNVIQTIERIIR